MKRIYNQSVAIVDDNKRSRERFAEYMLAEGYNPIVFDQKLSSLSHLLSEANNKNITYGIFDHRLTEGHYASFFGAQAVSAFNNSSKPSILVTGYENDDSETTIRLYRKSIPVLLHMSEVNPKTLNMGLEKVAREILEQEIPIERQPCRSILTIIDIIQKGSIRVAKVIVSQWDPKEEIGFPISMLPDALKEYAGIGKHFIANVNVDALRTEDIYFDNFELPNKDALNGI